MNCLECKYYRGYISTDLNYARCGFWGDKHDFRVLDSRDYAIVCPLEYSVTVH